MQYSSVIIILLLGFSWHTWQELQKTRRREKFLQDQLASKNGSIGQLDPHFLFNALNTIRYFVRTNTTTAREMLLDLALVLQTGTRRDDRIYLREELESGRAYLRLEQARLGERLTIADSIVDSNLDQLVKTHILSHILQALVASVAQRAAGGTIRLTLQNQTFIGEADGQATLPPGLAEQLKQTLTISSGETTKFEWRLV